MRIRYIFITVLIILDMNYMRAREVMSYDRASYDRTIYENSPKDQYALYQYLGKQSCESCRLRAIANAANVSERYQCFKTEIIQMIESDRDTLFFNRIYPKNIAIKYCLYNKVENISSTDLQYKWVCVNKTGTIIGIGSLLSEDGIRAMYRLLDSISSTPMLSMSQTFLFSLDDHEAPLILPVFPTRTEQEVICIGDNSRNTVMLFSLRNGKKMHETVIHDSIMSRVAKAGESSYYEDMSRPRLRAVGLAGDSSIRIIGYVPLATVDDAGVIFISNKPYYCTINYNTSEISIERIEKVCEDLYNYTYENALIYGDSVWATSPTWRIADTSYDSLYCLSVIDLKSCQIKKFGKIGEIYKHLNIGVNLCTGHVAVVDDEVYTTQTLTPWIIREKDQHRIKKNDSLFLIQQYEALEIGLKLSVSTKTTFQRADKYNPIIYTLAFFSLGNKYLVHVDYVPSESRAGCTIYNVTTGKERYYSDIKHGGFIQEGDSSFIVISRSQNGHEVYRYEIEE